MKTIVYITVWISVAVAVSVGIYVTKSAMPLWAFFFPVCVGAHKRSSSCEHEAEND